MKFAAYILLPVFLAATFAHAQSNNLTHVQHVIVVIQENRTPTNLFQQDAALITNGAHIVSSLQVNDKCGNSKGFALQSTGLFTCWDTGHNYDLPNAPDWKNMWDKGAMDGTCQISVVLAGNGHNWCPQQPSCVIQKGPPWSQTCSYSYVQNTVWDPNGPHRILDPYFQIASQFGYANYMFQTNQGPSFPAHLFLLGGTSAPDQINDSNDGTCGTDKCHQWFASENAHASNWGCIASSADIYEADPAGDNLPGIYNNGYPC